jgi:beta-glucosidase
MKKTSILGLLLVSFLGFSQQKTIDQRVDALLKQMTLEEKIGQLNQYTGNNPVSYTHLRAHETEL